MKREVILKEQRRLLTEAFLTLAPETKATPGEDAFVVLKNEATRSYLIVTNEEARALQPFRDGCRVPEALTRLINTHQCPSLRCFYELVLKAVKHDLLQEAGAPARPTVKPIRWPIRLGYRLSNLLAAGTILFGVVGLLGGSAALPGSWQEAVIGCLALAATLTLGQIWAASVIRGAGCSVYDHGLGWWSLFPHLHIDTRDALMGGRSIRAAAALARLAPVVAAAGWATNFMPSLSYPLLLGALAVCSPLLGGPGAEWLKAHFQKGRSATLSDFLFLQNRLFWTLLNLKAKYADLRYLLVFSVATLGWLWLVYWLHSWLFELEGAALLNLLWSHTWIRWAAFALLAALIAGMAFAIASVLWITLNNLRNLFRHSKRWKKIRSRFGFSKPQTHLPHEKVIGLLKQSPLFGDADADTLNAISGSLLAVQFLNRRFIMLEGEEGDCLYIIASGQVEVLRESSPGRLERVAILAEGEAFGEVALLDGTPRTRSIRSLGTTVLLAMRKEDFFRFVVDRIGGQKVKELLQRRMFLERIPLCADWPPHALAKCAEISRIEDIPAGRSVTYRGHTAPYVYIVYEGRFEATTANRGVSILRIGDLFGEISLLQNGVAQADIKALTDGRLLRIERSAFLHLATSEVVLGLQLEAVGSRRLGRPILPVLTQGMEAG